MPTHVERLVAVVLGPDEWSLDDVQVGAAHYHRGVATVREIMSREHLGFTRRTSSTWGSPAVRVACGVHPPYE